MTDEIPMDEGVFFDAEGKDLIDENDDGFKLIPAGLYESIIIGWKEVNSEGDEYANGDEYRGVKLSFQIIQEEGGFKNRQLGKKVFTFHSDPDKMKKSNTALATICNAVGVTKIKSPEELCSIPFRLKVVVGKADNGKEFNWVQNYLKMESPDIKADDATEKAPFE